MLTVVGERSSTKPRSCKAADRGRERATIAHFIYLYRRRVPELTDEQAAERSAAFGAWVTRLGPALLDVGSPFGAGTCLRDNGTETSAADLIGYSIIETDTLDAAKQLTDGLPLLARSDGKCAVDILELLSM